jgi:hypothetical protein
MTDRSEISELIDRYVVGLDTADADGRDDAWYARIFTADARLTFPIGERTGTAGLAAFQRDAKLAWQDTLHVSGNHVIDVDGDKAQARAQIIGTHVSRGVDPFRVAPEHRLDMGGYYDIEAVRTGGGWRISALRFVLVWTAGGGTPDGHPG